MSLKSKGSFAFVVVEISIFKIGFSSAKFVSRAKAPPWYTGEAPG
jgi:hypothetical protein